MSIWQRVTHQNPCPICQHADWCQFGDRAMKCMRVESVHTCDSGGWYHFYDDRVKPDFVPRREPERKTTLDAFGMIRGWRMKTTAAQYKTEAESLGVKMESLVMLGAAYAPEHRAWAFPMKDGDGNTVGIRLRNDSGFKWAVKGSRGGIFVPNETQEKNSIAYIPEGPTDTAALLSLGLFAIGRHGNNSGFDQVKRTLERLEIRNVVIVCDRDDVKVKVMPGSNATGRPGLDGANALRKFLGLRSIIWQPPPPLKDAREFVRAGGTAAMIESENRNRIWTKK